MRVRNKAIAAGICGAALIGGIAVASIAGSGGTAKIGGHVGTLTAVTGTAGAFDDPFWPGHQDGCTLSITNPNSIDVLVNSATAAGVHVATGPNVGDYTPAQYAGSVTFPVISPSNFVVGANTTGTVHVTDCADVADTDLTAQQGTQIEVHYTVVFQSH